MEYWELRNNLSQLHHQNQVQCCPIRSFIAFGRKNIIHESCQRKFPQRGFVTGEERLDSTLNTRTSGNWLLRSWAEVREMLRRKVWTKRMEQDCKSRQEWWDISYRTVKGGEPGQMWTRRGSEMKWGGFELNWLGKILTKTINIKINTGSLKVRAALRSFPGS